LTSEYLDEHDKAILAAAEAVCAALADIADFIRAGHACRSRPSPQPRLQPGLFGCPQLPKPLRGGTVQ
jgi:hypothetical protein